MDSSDSGILFFTGILLVVLATLLLQGGTFQRGFSVIKTHLDGNGDYIPYFERFQGTAGVAGAAGVAGITDTFSLKPKLWWIADDQTNARKWWDFGARNSRKPNRGYLELALDCVYATQGRDFDVQPLFGREDVMQLVRAAGGSVPEGVENMPVALWRQWATAALLATRGGLVLVGDSTLCIGPSFGSFTTSSQEAVFGIYPDGPRAVPGSETGPAPWAGWAAKPHSPGWDAAFATLNLLAQAGPTSWSAAEARRTNLYIWDLQSAKGIKFFQEADGGRLEDGHERTIADLLGRSTNPPPIRPGVVYIPMDGDRLVRSAEYGWFVRMSTKQILDSEFVWAQLAKKVKIGTF